MGLFGFGKKEPSDVTMPKTDGEKWVTYTYAMWSRYAEGDWHYIAGSTEKSKSEGASMRVMLRRDWGVNNKAALLDNLSFLFSLYEEGTDVDDEDIQIGAWDLCRCCQTLAMGYVGGYIEREEMFALSFNVGRVMQKYYHSWQELYSSYLNGYRIWRSEIGDGAQEDISAREKICSEILEAADGPSSLDWNMVL